MFCISVFKAQFFWFKSHTDVNITRLGEIYYNMHCVDSGQVEEYVKSASFVHILGSGLNSERPAHTAVHDLSERGWNPIPVHIRDAGGSVGGFPIRPDMEDRSDLEIIVLFLAPERSRDVVRRLLVANTRQPSLIWFQNGAEDDIAMSWLDSAGWNYVKDDCIVRFVQRHDLIVESNPLPWFKQVQSEDESGCSVWSVHEFGEDSPKGTSELEWIGDLRDLEASPKPVPAYIRSLMKETETLEQCARRLAK